MYLRKRAAEFLAMQDDLQKELLDIGGMIGGSLTVGSTHARSQVLLPAAFRAFQEKYPQVSVKLFEGSTDELELSLIHIFLLHSAAAVRPNKLSFFR